MNVESTIAPVAAVAEVASHPPPLPFVLSVGITGHRIEALEHGAAETVAQRLRAALEQVKEAASALYGDDGGSFSSEPPRFMFVSPLADGADQIAAEAALDLGFELHAILPFERRIYRGTLNGSGLDRFDRLLAGAACVLELPGEAEHALEAYVMAGRATVAHCDLLVAVWDGLAARGRGGTAEVVELAIARGTPVLHVPTDASEPIALRWAAFDPSVVTRRVEEPIERTFSREHLDQMLSALLTPPPDRAERRFVEKFGTERRRRWRTRIEYPLLLTVAGVGRVGAKDLRSDDCHRWIREDWEQYRTGCWSRSGLSDPLAPLEQWYGWSDSLATHFAQYYRSGHVFNFVLGALAVLFALAELVAGEIKPLLAGGEFASVVAILVNTHVGTEQQWHRRWLDYRQLAERLRPMRSLKLLGIAAPDPPGTAANPVPRRWVDWYAAGVWRAIGFPSGTIRPGDSVALAEAISAHELRPQIAYHHRSGIQSERLDRRLEAIGTTLFSLAVISCVLYVAGVMFRPHWVHAIGNWSTVISAGLPAIGTAVFGIRIQGDYGASAVRSEESAISLDRIADRLETDNPSLSRAADLVEHASRSMVSELSEWALLNRQHDLSVG